ncbi:DNA cytosine methyltransferase [Bacillus bombysepticus]|uniref:DNA cytosine methyltransferase n=1 Tax=Bacillus bombysepticus TaxID=658666 RepID=UPI00301B5C35
MQMNLFREIVVDNFAGGGGASAGIEAATGLNVDIAINHDPDAVKMHKANHKDTEHYCESVWQVNPKEVVKNSRVSLCWVSPDCKHFSKSKGGKPVDKNIRGLAWVAVRWAATFKPRTIMLENVEEFKTWGPLLKNGFPDMTKQGNTFRAFINALKRHGYQVECKELQACDYGAATSRNRLFLIARCDGKPIVWPKPTYGDPTSPEVMNGELKPWLTAASIVDWSIPCKSILNRKKPLAEKSMARICRGIDKFVLNNPNPYIVDEGIGKDTYVTSFLTKYYGSDTGQSLTVPLHTITTKDKFGLVTVTLSKKDNVVLDIGLRMLQPRELFNAQGFSEDYIIDKDHEGNKYPKWKQVARCGNAVPPVFSEQLVRANLPEICVGAGKRQLKEVVAM